MYFCDSYEYSDNNKRNNDYNNKHNNKVVLLFSKTQSIKNSINENHNFFKYLNKLRLYFE